MTNDTSRFIRWQKIAIDQLSYALNLVLALTVATLGYWFTLLKDKEFAPGPSAKCAMLLSLTALLASTVSGVVCVLCRLWDFRGTARRVGGHPEAQTTEELRGLGRTTWQLFYAHVTLFALGVAALAMALLLTYGGKLT
jgi:hypothetical protein